MRRSVLFIFSALFFTACSDGDIIVTNFDFEGQTINLCRTAQVGQTQNIKYVFSKINPDTGEALALEFITDLPILSETTTDGEPYTIAINGTTSKMSYRLFDGAVTADYFCNAIPPATPIVNEEYVSNEGTVVIRVSGTLIDNDGISSEVEQTYVDSTGTVNADLDDDGIPNFYDFDDDGDNIPTANEGVELNEDGTINYELSRDSDGDGIPDFLDPDDDGDGILTRNEDQDGDLNPTNDSEDGLTDDYLNPNVRNSYNINQYIPHIYQLTDIQVTIELINLVFENTAADDIIRREQLLFETYTAGSQTITITPEFVE